MRRILTEPEASLIKQYVALMQNRGASRFDITRRRDRRASAGTWRSPSIRPSRISAPGRLQNRDGARARRDFRLPAPDRHGETIRIDADYVQKHVGDLAKNADLSRFIL